VQTIAVVRESMHPCSVASRALDQLPADQQVCQHPLCLKGWYVPHCFLQCGVAPKLLMPLMGCGDLHEASRVRRRLSSWYSRQLQTDENGASSDQNFQDTTCCATTQPRLWL